MLNTMSRERHERIGPCCTCLLGLLQQPALIEHIIIDIEYITEYDRTLCRKQKHRRMFRYSLGKRNTYHSSANMRQNMST